MTQPEARTERDANASMAASVSTRMCPPCTGRCHQGRSCPASVARRIDDDGISVWIGLRNALILTAASIAIGLGGCELLRGVGL